MYSLMKNLFRKLNRWYSGYIDIQNRIDDKEELVSTIIVYPQSTAKRFVLFVRGFWLQNYKWIIRTIIAAGVLAVLIFDYFKN